MRNSGGDGVWVTEEAWAEIHGRNTQQIYLEFVTILMGGSALQTRV
jgi:hypothetical protein